MTVATSYAPIRYNGNDATTAFPVTWPFFDGTLIVTLIDSDGVETVQTLTTHYTVTGGTDANGLPATGTVTMVTAPATGKELVLTRSTPKTQASVFGTATAFPAKTVEASFDKALLITQEAFYSAFEGVTGQFMQLNTAGATDYWDAESNVIRNVADAENSTDAVNYAQLQAVVVAAGGGDVVGPASATNGRLAAFDGVTGKLLKDSGVSASASVRHLAGGRLTLTTATPILTASVSGAATLYWTPYLHATIGLYTGSAWILYEFAEMSIALSGGTASRMHDVFLDYNDGTPALSLTAWTNDTTRATALTTQDGVYVLTGDTQKRYLGSIYISASNQCNFIFGATGAGGTAAFLDLWNENNRVEVITEIRDTTNSWTYATSSWREANNSAGNRATFVVGRQVWPAHGIYNAISSASSSQGRIGVGYDSTTAVNGGSIGIYSDTQTESMVALRSVFPQAGRHYMSAMEYVGSGTHTFYGDAGAADLQSAFHFRGWF